MDNVQQTTAPTATVPVQPVVSSCHKCGAPVVDRTYCMKPECQKTKREERNARREAEHQQREAERKAAIEQRAQREAERKAQIEALVSGAETATVEAEAATKTAKLSPSPANRQAARIAGDKAVVAADALEDALPSNMTAQRIAGNARFAAKAANNASRSPRPLRGVTGVGQGLSRGQEPVRLEDLPPEQQAAARADRERRELERRERQEKRAKACRNARGKHEELGNKYGNKNKGGKGKGGKGK